MRTLPVIPPTAPQLDDDQIVPEELVGRLYRASENAKSCEDRAPSATVSEGVIAAKSAPPS